MSYLSGFPDRWEPAVKWLEDLMESSDELNTSRLSGVGTNNPIQIDGSSTNPNDVQEGDSGALYMMLPSSNGSFHEATFVESNVLRVYILWITLRPLFNHLYNLKIISPLG